MWKIFTEWDTAAVSDDVDDVDDVYRLYLSLFG